MYILVWAAGRILYWNGQPVEFCIIFVLYKNFCSETYKLILYDIMQHNKIQYKKD